MKITILTIATGKYDIFFKDFVESCDKYFLPGNEKKYFIFTDSENIQSSEKVTRIDQKKMGWPYDTLMRFHMFLTIEEEMRKSDFVFFFNVNMEFINEIGEEVLPDGETTFLVGVKHPGFFKLPSFLMPYERRKESNFCISDIDENMMYYQGCFNGGESSMWIEMCKELSGKIDDDLRSNVIPVWHDESAINWYFKSRNIVSLEPNYAIPEAVLSGNFQPASTNNVHCYHYLTDVKPYAVQRDKSNYGGSDFLRS